jgi:hypothetical protein
MNSKKVKIVLIGVAFTFLSLAYLLILDFFVLGNISDWSMKLFQKYLIIDFNIQDKILIRWFPLLLSIIVIYTKDMGTKSFIRLILSGYITVSFSLLLGYFLAVITWTSGGAISPLLPEYIKYQPFTNYWALFILFGIVLAIWLHFKKGKESSSELIDDNSSERSAR